MINEKQLLNLIDDFEAYGSAETTGIILEYAKLKNNAENFKKDKTVYVLVGPSGSGKSTFIANMYKKNVFGNTQSSFVPFVNRHYANTSMSLNQEIVFKTNLLENGSSFMIESANFDENYSSFIKLMKLKYDYKICLLYLTKWHPKENISMVQKRKIQGGHGSKNIELNETELERMYKVDSRNLVEVMPYCDCCFVINNTTKTLATKNEKPILLLHKGLNGEIVYNTEIKNINFLYYRILKSKKLLVPKPKQLEMRFYVNPEDESKTVMLPTSNKKQETPLVVKVDKILDGIKDFSLEDAKRQYTEKEQGLIVSTLKIK